MLPWERAGTPNGAGPRRRCHPLDLDSETEAILDAAEAAGLVEAYIDDEGRQVMRLTPVGERVARQLAMTDEAGQDDLVAALLGHPDEASDDT